MSRWLIALTLLFAVPLVRAEPVDRSQDDASAKPEPKGALPWSGARPSRLPGKRFENAREYLELLGVDPSQWKNLFHDQPLGAADEEWINRILFHLPRVGEE